MKKITPSHLNFKNLNETKITTTVEKNHPFQHVVKLVAACLLLFGSYTTATAQCPTPPGNPAAYGTNSWIGYVYATIDTANPPARPFSAPTEYKGYVTQPELFEQNLGAVAIAGANLCGTYADGFSIRFRMTRTFPAGNYTFVIGGDDGVRLSLDGGATWEISDWSHHSYQTATKTIHLSGTKNMVLEYYDQGGESRVSFNYTAICDAASTAPATLSGTTTICNGSSTTLTASGGSALADSYYIWGTGATVGSNIIAGQNTASIVVSPSANTTYWVRRKDPAPCNTETPGIIAAVTVNPKSTAPTSIGGNKIICAGNSTTLTAIGGTLAAGSTYEWGTGTVGSNIISGQTAAAIIVSPSETTTYWVRRLDAGPTCAGYTTGVFETVIVNIPAGDQTSYGDGSWIGYVYANTESASPPSNAFTTTYRGYITENETFNHNWIDAGIAGTYVCGSYADLVAIKFKMKKNFPAGWYTFTVGGDDGYRLSLDGGATYAINSFVDHSYASSVSNAIYLNGDTNLVLDYYERTGQAQVSFSYTACNNYSTAPTSITGTNSICTGSNTTLTAIGGNAAPGTTYQWGTGTVVGSNVVSTSTSPTYTTANLTTNTTYWVRRVDATPCNAITEGTSQMITVMAKSTAPLPITGTTTVCKGTPITLNANGGATSSATNYQWGTGTVSDANAIADANTATLITTPTASARYWVRRFDAAPCNTYTTSVVVNVTVVNPSTGPASITGTATYCIGSAAKTLKAVGGILSTGAVYQWGSGTVSDDNELGTTTTTTYNVTPAATTTYWVRTKDNGSPCSTVSDAVTFTVTVTTPSTAPTSISDLASICNNVAGGVSITAVGGIIGSSAVYQWGSGAVNVGNVFLTESTGTITVNPTASTTYWVRRLDATPCSITATGAASIIVYPTSTAPTSISGPATYCLGTGAKLLTPVGGKLINNAVYQWGSGTVSDANALGTSTGTFNVSPTETTTYWVRTKDNNAPCIATSEAVTFTITVSTPSTTPTSISDAASICNVSQSGVAITAIGGTMGTGASYQWGKGAVNAANVFMTESTGTITVNPAVATSYWVRRVDSAPCGVTTATVSINVIPTSIAPTSITGPATHCLGSTGKVLTAVGGTLYNGAVYQWGTGTDSDANALGTSGAATFNVSPNVTTTYWVRVKDASPCSVNSAAVFFTMEVFTPSTQPTSISNLASTCNNVAGGITLTAVGGTEGTGATYNWGTGYSVGANVIAGETASTILVNPSAQTVYWVRRIDTAPCSTQTQGPTIIVYVPSSPPTSLTATNNITTICAGTGINLTASGATIVNGALYQFGSGEVTDANALVTAASPVYTLTPAVTTTYWVRMKDATPCNTFSTPIFITITVNTKSTAPTSILNAAKICNSGTIIIGAVGGVAGTGSNYQWGTGNTVGAAATVIPDETAQTITVNPLVETIYWVRRIDPAPCNTATGGATITVSPMSTAPTSLTGPANVCSSTTATLVASGGISGHGSTYQWGTGTVPGTGTLTGTASSINVTVSETTTYWVRRTNIAPCGTLPTDAIFLTITALPIATAPTSVSGTSPICRGTTITLTAVGGTGDVFEWGTGGTVGTSPIAGETGISINVAPLSNTTYWVRRVNTVAPCSGATAGRTFTVNVTAPSVAPTSITVSGAAGCPGTNRTLTATGGTLASGAVYQWGSGEVGTNIIAGTSNAITVKPNATTDYWVRIKDSGTCSAYTTEAIKTVVVNAPAGDPNTFGNNAWNVYGYANADITLATNVYMGSYTQAAAGMNFDSSTSWATTLAPSNAPGWTGCTIPADNFVFTAKRKGFPCGTYTLKMLNWDDVAELYVDGILKWTCTDWSANTACTGNVTGTFNLNENSTIEIRVKEIGGNANAALSFTNVTVASTAITAIAATNATVCNGAPTTLTATGGTSGSTAVFQWGTGTVGNNIIAGETAASILVSPTATTTYWARRISVNCGTATAEATIQITEGTTVAGTISTAPTTICRGTKPKDITLSGNTGSVVKWQSASNAAFTANVVDIASTATILTSSALAMIYDTTYYRAVVQNAGCTAAYTPALEIVVPAAIVFENGVWSGTPTDGSSVLIKGNITLTEDLHVCSCQVANGAVVTVGVGQNLIVVNNLIVDPTANIIVEDQGSIVQVEDSALDIGSITVKRKTSAMKNYDFSYWSSPVIGQTLYNLSPLTRYDKYYSFDPIVDNYVIHLNGAAVMQPAVGYLLRAPLNWSTTNEFKGQYEGTFKGVPNNGVVPVAIKKGAGTSNLIGNPYPSAIDIDLFLTDPENVNLVNGTIYLWTHNTAISSTIPGNTLNNYTADDYAKYNLTGGVQSASSIITGGTKPDGKIASGQSFFIEAKTGIANGTYTAKFKNSMRVAGSNGNFYKVGGPVARIASVEKNRLWVNISNANGAYNEILVGYIGGATNAFDAMYDGPLMDGGNSILLYSLLGTDQYSIQGRQLPFSDTDVVPLGYKSTTAGNFKIQLEQFDGLFDAQNVYLIDHVTNVTHDLKASAYTFTTAIGSFNSRFELVYKNHFTAVGTHTITAIANVVQVIPDGQSVNVRSAKIIKAIAVFDLLGRKLYSNDKVNAIEFKTPDLSRATQTLIVKMVLENDEEVSEKVILI